MKPAKELLFASTGPLTRELIREPSQFGLGQLPTNLQPDGIIRSVCGYCSTGCSLDVHIRNGEGINVSPTTDYPVNLGMACPKGWEALSVLDAGERATRPLLRDDDGRVHPTDWPTAIQAFVTRFRNIQRQHGNHAVAFLSTGQIVTEEMAFLGALAKFGMRMLHGDGNTRQCMATAVVAYKQAFGFDAPPYTYADFEQSDVLVFIGSNPCIAHPIMWERVMRNPHNPDILVIDPRRTETAMSATQHLAVFPKSDLSLCYGLARRLMQTGGVDERFVADHTSGFDAFREFVEPYTAERVAADTGLESHEIVRAAETIRQGRRVSFWWTMGVNQSHQGVRTAQAIINLALMTGNIGRPGTGANSITGQCNAMGSRLFSNTTSLFGGRDYAVEADRQKTAATLGIDADTIPDQPSWAYDQILEGIVRGKIRGLWVVCTNPADSWINQQEARDVLSRLEFLVVQDMYADTSTARLANLLLPAAGWGEKEGTFINSERRVSVTRKVHHAPGQALSDFRIFRLIADAWGCGEMFRAWETPESVFRILTECTRGTPCDMTGLTGYAQLTDSGGIQWPYTEGDAESEPAAERRLFANGQFFHADGRARFITEQPQPLREPVSDSYPLILLTGRGSAAQWHTQTRTARSAVLRKLYPAKVYVEINPRDAQKIRVRNGQQLRISSRRGSVQASAFLTHSVQPGQVFMPMHYAETNQLTDAVVDPYSRQPAYKACAVRIESLR